jgi:hypothetical protein
MEEIHLKRHHMRGRCRRRCAERPWPDNGVAVNLEVGVYVLYRC